MTKKDETINDLKRDVLFYDNSFEYVKNSLFDKISCMKDYYSNVCKAYTENESDSDGLKDFAHYYAKEQYFQELYDAMIRLKDNQCFLIENLVGLLKESDLKDKVQDVIDKLMGD